MAAMNRFSSSSWLSVAAVLVVACGLVLLMVGADAAFAAPSNHPKLEHRLADLADIAPQGPAAVAAYARGHGLKLKNGLVRVLLVPAPDASINAAAVAARGAIIDGSALGLVRVLVGPGRMAQSEGGHRGAQKREPRDRLRREQDSKNAEVVV